MRTKAANGNANNSGAIKYHSPVRPVPQGNGHHHFCPATKADYWCDAMGCRLGYLTPKAEHPSHFGAEVNQREPRLREVRGEVA